MKPGLLLLDLCHSLSCAILFLMAASKLVQWPWSARAMWRPEAITRKVFAAAVGVISILELIFASVALMYHHPSITVYALGIILFVVVSFYGTVSIQKTGRCGCAGNSDMKSELNGRPRLALLTRNVVLFGLAILGGTRLTGASEQTQTDALLACTLATLPMASLIVSFLVRFSRMAAKKQVQTADSIYYRAGRAYLLQNRL